MTHTAALTGLLLAAAAAPMLVQSTDIAAGRTIPKAFMAARCGGWNRSPSLAWSNAPAPTRSFAIVMHDPDAPLAGGFYHWVVYNLPASVHHLAANATLASDQLGMTSRGTAGYTGPCPPPGPAHHYHFTVYALDLGGIVAAEPLTGAELAQRMQGHVLARAELVATAAMP